MKCWESMLTLPIYEILKPLKLHCILFWNKKLSTVSENLITQCFPVVNRLGFQDVCYRDVCKIRYEMCIYNVFLKKKKNLSTSCRYNTARLYFLYSTKCTTPQIFMEVHSMSTFCI